MNHKEARYSYEEILKKKEERNREERWFVEAVEELESAGLFSEQHDAVLEVVFHQKGRKNVVAAKACDV